MKGKYVSTRPNGARDYCGIGNIVIPKDKDPQQYITRCFRTGMVSIVLENGGIVDNVIVSKSAIKDLAFPDDYKSLGSQVIWLNKPRQNQPIIIGIFSKNNELINVSRYKDSMRKASQYGLVEMIVDSSKGVAIINSTSFSEKGGDIYIISTNKQQSSKLNIMVSGTINITTPDLNIINSDTLSIVIKDSTKDKNVTSISYTKGKGFSYADEFGNKYIINQDNIQFSPKSKFNIGNGNQPIPLGNALLEQLQNTQAQVTAIITALSVIGISITLPPGVYDSSLLSGISNTD
jgi:hypothetical protein